MSQTAQELTTGAPDRAEPGAGVARNAFHLLLGQAATTALALVTSAALGRFLGAEDFGLFYLMITLSTFAYVLVEWGQALFVVRQVAMEPARTGDWLGTAITLRVAFAAAVIVPVALVGLALGYRAHTIALSVLYVVASLPMFLAQAFGMAFRAHDQMGKDALVSVANKAAALCVTIPTLWLGWGVPGITLALAAGGLLSLALARRLYRRMGAGRLSFSSRTARELLAGGSPIVAMTAAISAQPYLDAVILSKLAPASAVGWFGAAKGILGTLMAPAVILGTAAYPRVARASKDMAAFRREVRAALRPLLWIAALGATGTYLFASAVIRIIYGSAGFGPAATILEVFAPGLFLLFIDILLGNVIYASGGGTGFAIGKIISVAVGSGLDILLIPIFQQRYGNGGIGVIVAFALSEIVVFVGAVVAMRRRTFEAGSALDVVRALASAGLTIAALRLLPPVPFWAGVPLCIATFTAISASLGLIGRAELAMAVELVRSRRGS